MIDYSLILSECYTGKSWVLEGDDYAGLTWNDESPKPTQAELDALWESAKAKVDAKIQAQITAKQTAQAKLAKLGLTPEDLKALLG